MTTMTFNVSQFFLLGVICASMHWIIARSEVTRPIWSRASGWLGMLLACAGCSGWWLGLALGGERVVTPLVLARTDLIGFIEQTIATAILGVFVTPVFESVLLWGLQESAIQESQPETDEDKTPVTSHDSVETPVDNPMRRQ